MRTNVFKGAIRQGLRTRLPTVGILSKAPIPVVSLRQVLIAVIGLSLRLAQPEGRCDFRIAISYSCSMKADPAQSVVHIRADEIVELLCGLAFHIGYLARAHEFF